MKIGILTFHETTNFGSFLQTYGLYMALTKLGYVCEVIDYKCESIMKRELPSKRPRSMSLKEIAKYLLIDRRIRKKYMAFQKALYSTMRVSKEFNKCTIGNSNDYYDYFLVGSDILWNFSITEGDTTYFLDFVKESKKKYAFSTSIGNPWSDEELIVIRPLIREFRKISLREFDSVDWISNLLKRKIPAVCDPTMLLEVESWDKLIQDDRNVYGEYILLYFADDQMILDAKRYGKIHNWKVILINYGLSVKGVKNVRPYEISEFLLLIKYAKVVFTSSYHGMLFSIYNKIPFYCYMRTDDSNNNVRFKSVLDRLGLWECNRNREGEFREIIIDYNRVDIEVHRWRQESFRVLREYWRE